MMAPAVSAGSRPIFAAMPIRPMPTVPATVHELPIETAITAQIRQEVM